MKTRRNINIVMAFFFLSVGVTQAATKYAKIGGLTTGTCNTWANACTMERALSVAVSGDSIWAKKTAGGSPYGPMYLKNGVKVIGGFAGTETQASQSNPTTKVTTIDGGGTQQCVLSDSNSSSTILRGFTISNCRNGDPDDWDGGGGLLSNSSDATFVACIFENNTSVRFGAAVAIRGTGSPKFFNCIFRNNGSGSSGSDEDVNAQPIAGGAVYLHSGSPSFTNCLFYGNKAAGGAVIANRDGTPTFVNCTLANNYAKYSYGGALFDESAKGIFRNCIVWGNTAIKAGNQILNAPSISTTVTHSNVEGGWTGAGNLNVDPLFVNASGGDYKLQETTPCDNVGNGAMPDDVGDLDWDTITSEPVPVDLGGGLRVNATIDMGAYEIQAGSGPD